ncbi:hypothetical protein TNCV_2133581 [Trichonephila clavipes]|nr:hypothetical protein TNCV_2133581 [Trichonephila clavipes]
MSSSDEIRTIQVDEEIRVLLLLFKRSSLRRINLPGEIYLTARRAPLAVRHLEALTPGNDDGIPPGTKDNQLTQQPIAELPLAMRERSEQFVVMSSGAHSPVVL